MDNTNGTFDIGLFTYSLQNSDIYDSICIYKKSPDLTLKESKREIALVSDVLDLEVFKLQISQKAKQHFFKVSEYDYCFKFP